MTAEPTTSTGRRRWQDVARDRGIPLRILGELLDRNLSTMLAYSSGRRRVPEEVLWKLGRIFGEDVQ